MTSLWLVQILVGFEFSLLCRYEWPSCRPSRHHLRAEGSVSIDPFTLFHEEKEKTNVFLVLKYPFLDLRHLYMFLSLILGEYYSVRGGVYICGNIKTK